MLAMKLHLLLPLLLLGGAIAPEAARSQSVGDTAYICTSRGEWLYVRRAPGGEVLTSLAPGTPVVRTGPIEGNWQPIAAEGITGYAWSDYVTPTCRRFASTPPPAVPTAPVPVPAPQPRCRGDLNEYIVTYEAGLGIHRLTNFTSDKIDVALYDSIVRTSGETVTDESGLIWQPIDRPDVGFIAVGSDGEIRNIVPCPF